MESECNVVGHEMCNPFPFAVLAAVVDANSNTHIKERPHA